MALDQQRNWDISMAETVERVRLNARKQQEEQAMSSLSTRLSDTSLRPFKGPPIHLPDEIIVNILECILLSNETQKTLAECCRLSHQWYSISVPYLYERPRLYGKNFDPFARTICPSINLHVRKSPLSSLIKELDLGRLVHQGSKSITARLLGRTKTSLESFRAPQASFAINCLPALARCLKLRSLDLSLVSESPPLPDLLKAVAHLEQLVSFWLPRSSGFGSLNGDGLLSWPRGLQNLALSGGIDAWFLAGVAKFPDTLLSLSLEHCPHAKSTVVTDFLIHSIRKLPALTHVKISNMPRFDAHAMDDILWILPSIHKLSISVDYISPGIFDDGGRRRHVLEYALERENKAVPSRLRHENLHTLELTNSGNPSVEDKITPIDVLIALDDDVLPALRIVRVAKSLFWQSGETMRDADALNDALQARIATAESDSDAPGAGVWSFEG